MKSALYVEGSHETNGRTLGLARLQLQGIEEQVEPDNIAFQARGVGLGGGRPTVLLDKGSVDVVEHVGPYFADAVYAGHP